MCMLWKQHIKYHLGNQYYIMSWYKKISQNLSFLTEIWNLKKKYKIKGFSCKELNISCGNNTIRSEWDYDRRYSHNNAKFQVSHTLSELISIFIKKMFCNRAVNCINKKICCVHILGGIIVWYDKTNAELMWKQ